MQIKHGLETMFDLILYLIAIKFFHLVQPLPFLIIAIQIF